MSPRFETLAIHGGQHRDPGHGAVMEPIVLASTFAQPAPGQPLRFDYSRSGNPTRAALEAALAALEGGTAGFAFASGCAAAATLLHTLRPGDRVLCGDDVYGGTYRLFERVMKPLGIEAVFADLRAPERLALDARTRMIWLEFASPVLQRPLELGATAVVHSTTKYINGHSDVVGGAIVTRDAALAERLGYLQNAIGAVPSPMDCYLVLRGLKTLPVRMQRHAESALELAGRLEGARGVKRVHHPFLPGHPQQALARRQMRAGGGMISLELEGGLEESRRFLQALRLFTLAESLGGVESLAEHPALMTHASIPAEVRRGLGIGDGLIRLSVGLEHVEDLWADLEGALAASRAPG
jgi:cystathionine beta-lyase/cystathionine gamma-synthase